jgi:hypothetical protein
MRRQQIRCYRGYAQAFGRWNIEVLYTMPDLGYHMKLFMCIECGEILFMDMCNPALARKTVQEIVGDEVCPRCGRLLRGTLQEYPENFLTEDGRIGHFDPGRRYPPDSESLFKEIWQLP